MNNTICLNYKSKVIVSLSAIARLFGPNQTIIFFTKPYRFFFESNASSSILKDIFSDIRTILGLFLIRHVLRCARYAHIIPFESCYALSVTINDECTLSNGMSAPINILTQMQIIIKQKNPFGYSRPVYVQATIHNCI